MLPGSASAIPEDRKVSKKLFHLLNPLHRLAARGDSVEVVGEEANVMVRL